ncbi:MAG: transglycosylase domain-containing protein [Clostridia bacterium]
MKAQKKTKNVVIVFLISVLFIILCLGGAVFFITKGTKLDANAIVSPSAKAIMYDNEGREIKYSSSLSAYTDYENISPHIIDAFVALEDKRFYNHHGIDLIRVAGAGISNIKAGYMREGGSTITQQLAKNTLLTNEKTYQRKLKEAKLALQIEKEFEKSEILAMYLNAIYFGGGIYGITRVCDELYGKTPLEISLPEAAIIAGIVKNPRDYSPLTYPEKAEERKNLVLRLMREQGKISESEYETAINYTYTPVDTPKSYYSYQSAAIEEAAEKLSISEKAVITDNYQIYTYQNPREQIILEGLFKGGTCEAEKADYAALVADNKSGGVSAYCSNFNMSVLKVRRQPGSAIKPIAVYAPALDAGYISPATPILDEKTDFGGYTPANYANYYAGWTDISEAVRRSSNVVAVRIAHEIGIDYCKYMGEQAGLKFEDEDGLALALGGMTNGATIPEITSAYMTLANSGQYRPITFIREIKLNGKTVYKDKSEQKEVFSAESSYLMTDMLIETAKYGTAKKLSDLPFDVASKTGTVGRGSGDKNSDAWNLSYTTQNTVCVWYGSLSNDENNMPAKNVTGGAHPTILAKAIHQNLGVPDSFTKPNGIVSAEIDTYALDTEHLLVLAAASTPKEYRKERLFDESYLPNAVSTCFDDVIPKDLSAVLENGNTAIRLTPKANFIYKVYKTNGESPLLLATIEHQDSYFCVIDEHTNFGLNSYFITAETSEGVECAKSPQINILSFKLF